METVPNTPGQPERRPHIRDTEETAPARTARIGDDLSTPIGWMTITEVVDHGHAIELVTVDRQSVGHAWTSGPDDEHLFRRANFAHFPWCSEEHCGALDPQVGYHRGAPVTIETGGVGSPRFVLQMWGDAMEGQATARVTVVLTIDSTVIPGLPNVHSIDLEPDVVAALVDELTVMDSIFARGAQ